ncbi:N-acetylmuramoyl-L-alanine amidase [Legionella busanensis]|uniref:N-acetylmuramoyl-L-alanine amidase AmiC n=1 Tax=Legionella busanensis TaxID=190655 RepID=A0A378JRN1_9GAMM|nr:N-acetylmuramoyl-L-alanine amidase [Legionella busanensis]STX52540.1 N-acetylmuramoyl-L-alanine amidase [Legionella busanensis]
MRIQIIVFSLCMLFNLVLNAAKLKGIEIKQDLGKASLLFNLDKAINHKIFTLTNPDRVVVDLENTELAFDLHKLNLNKNLVTRVRSGYQNKHTLRLVFEVANKVMLETKPWNTLSRNRNGFSLNISTNHLDLLTKSIKNVPPLSPLPIKQVRKPLRDVIVVLDPGHGGKDPGAIGPRRTAEKNVTLSIATKLKQIIDKQPGMRAVLTRTGDYYVGLRERLAIARKYNGDVFISIHADAFINRDSNGASVFALSQRGATSEAARWLAEKENYSELGGVNLAGLDDQSGLVRTVLIDLSQTATIGASLHMGEKVLRNLNTLTKLHNNKVEQARFMVLKSPDIPSILIETGFITNPREERNLTSTYYQTRLTQSIFQGLRGYFWEYPPHGTHIEALVNSKMRFTLGSVDNKLPKSIANHHSSTVALGLDKPESNNA